MKCVPVANRLLAGLPRKEAQRLLASGEQVELAVPEILNEPAEPIRHVYFPTGSTISLVSMVDDRSSFRRCRVTRLPSFNVTACIAISTS